MHPRALGTPNIQEIPRKKSCLSKIWRCFAVSLLFIASHDPMTVACRNREIFRVTQGSQEVRALFHGHCARLFVVIGSIHGLVKTCDAAEGC